MRTHGYTPPGCPSTSTPATATKTFAGHTATRYAAVTHPTCTMLRRATTRATPSAISTSPDSTTRAVAAGIQPGRCCSNGVGETRCATPATTRATPSPMRAHLRGPDRRVVTAASAVATTRTARKITPPPPPSSCATRRLEPRRCADSSGSWSHRSTSSKRLTSGKTVSVHWPDHNNELRARPAAARDHRECLTRRDAASRPFAVTLPAEERPFASGLRRSSVPRWQAVTGDAAHREPGRRKVRARPVRHGHRIPDHRERFDPWASTWATPPQTSQR
jgi:hypothetical protein